MFTKNVYSNIINTCHHQHNLLTLENQVAGRVQLKVEDCDGEREGGGKKQGGEVEERDGGVGEREE